MKIAIIGAGPAGLTFAALMKRQDPRHDITLYERGPRHATWGFGVVFSDRALEFLRADDEELYQLPDAAHGDLAAPDHPGATTRAFPSPATAFPPPAGWNC
jgi:2-polyprenyl-6-methoxyphenol hydroxylase-like FAD-dependent oxidoreductase